MMTIGAAVGAASGLVGLCAAALWDIAAGGAIALSAGALFLFSLGVTKVSASRRV
jgi:ABC-type Mn2+/Zn2+ transport system permease subunit